MYKRLLTILFLFLLNIGQSQNLTLAKTFFDDGDYEKAAIECEKLLKKQPHRTDYLISMVKCYQELENLLKAESLLNKAINIYSFVNTTNIRIKKKNDIILLHVQKRLCPIHIEN